MPPTSEFLAGSQIKQAQFKSRPRKIMNYLFRIKQLPLSDCSTSGRQWWGAKILEVTRKDVFKIRDALGLQVSPEMKVLGILLLIFAIAHSLTVLGLVIAMCAF